MATATFNLGDATFTAPTQAEANNKRDAALVDFCKFYGLNIYVNGSQTVDPAKVVPAVRAQVLKISRDAIRAWRVEQAAKAQQTIPDDF